MLARGLVEYDAAGLPAYAQASSNKRGYGGKYDVKYAIVIERAASTFSAYVPDLAGCVATGVPLDETGHSIRLAIELHLAGMREDGLSIPTPAAQVEYVDVAF